MLYTFGRALQFIGLLVMPSAMWFAEVQHSEARSIGVFVGAGVLFLIGMMLTRFSNPKA